MEQNCKTIIESYIRLLLGSESDRAETERLKNHIRSCTWCRANLSVFSTILEEKLSRTTLSALSCADVASFAANPAGLSTDSPQRQEILNHMISCKTCRESFVDRFVRQFEKDASVFSTALDIPEMKSPLMLLEIRREKKHEVISAIRTAEASIVRIKPDGGMTCGLNDLIEKRIESLPPYPDNVRQIVELIDIDADLTEISREVSRDVSLTARILQIANSQHYRGRHPIDDIQRGLSRIGLQVVSRIVKVFGLHTTIMKQAGTHLAGYDIPMKAFMNYSTMLAVIAMALAPKYDPRLIREKEADFSLDIDMVAYTAGLVSNLGMIVLDRCIDKTFRDRIRENVSQGREITEVERELFGITHPEVSARILKKWNLSEAFIDSIVSHHARSGAGEGLLSDILSASDTIAADFLRPTSRVRPFLNIIKSEEELFRRLPFTSRRELSAFYTGDLLPAFEGHKVQYDKNQFI